MGQIKLSWALNGIENFRDKTDPESEDRRTNRMSDTPGPCDVISARGVDLILVCARILKHDFRERSYGKILINIPAVLSLTIQANGWVCS